MNQLINIERAKVLNMSPLETGNNDNGPWAKVLAVVEYDVNIPNPTKQIMDHKCRMVISFRGDLAMWASQNVKAGNPYNGTPDFFLNLTLLTWGSIREYDKKDGVGKGYMDNNTLEVYQATIAQ